MQHPAVGRDIEQIGLRLQQIGGAAMRHQHALGLAGGTGGIDDIGRMRRGQADGGRRDIVGRLSGPLRGFCRHVDQGGQTVRTRHRALHRIAAECVDQRDRRKRVLQHVAQAFAGIGRIERNVRAARFEHREHRCDPCDRTLHADADQRTRTDPAFAQRARRTVRVRVEIAVIDGIVLTGRRQRARRERRMSLEPCVDRTVQIVIGCHAIAASDRRQLLLRQQMQGAQRRIGRGQALIQQ